MAEQDGWLNAAIGAVITIVFSFTGFSPLLGGGVAGYLHGGSRKRGAKVGAISGALAMIPAFLLMGFIATAFMAYATPNAMMPGGLELLIIFGMMLPIMFLWVIGLSAVGGYLGAYLSSKMQSKSGKNISADLDEDTESVSA